MNKLISYYLSSGIIESYSEEKKRQIRLFNFCIGILIVSSLPFGFIFKNEIYSLSIFLSSYVFQLIAFLLNRNHKHLIAKYLITIVHISYIQVMTPLFLLEVHDLTFVKVLYLSNLAMPFFMFDKTEKKHLFVMVVFIILALMTLDWFNSVITLQLTQLDFNTTFNRNLIITNAFVIVCSSYYYFFNLYNKTIEEIEEQNHLLMQQQEEISAQKDQLAILNENLIAQNIEIEKNNKLKTKVLSIISHDIREPFHAIKGVISLLELNINEPQIFDLLKTQLKSSIDHSYISIDNILKWTIIEMYGHNVNKTVFKIKNEIDTVISFYIHVIEQKKIKILNNVNPEALIEADIDQINLVIRNLFSNALKFTKDNGEIEFNGIENEKYWLISIKDNGVGMNENQMKNLFEVNTTKSTIGTNKEKGTGLGLVLCKDFIEENGGKIEVHSVQNEGSTFTITLPKVGKN